MSALTRRSYTVSSLSMPYVVESTSKGDRVFDIFSRLLKERVVMLNGEVNDSSSAVIVAQLLFLESETPDLPIHLYVFFFNQDQFSWWVCDVRFSDIRHYAVYIFSCSHSLYRPSVFHGKFTACRWRAKSSPYTT